MDAPELKLTFIPSPDDPRPSDTRYQEELGRFEQTITSQGLEVSALFEFRESASPGFISPYMGEFYIKLASLAATTIGVLGMAISTWLRARYGRKVRLKIGEIEAEAQSLEDVERLLQRAEQFQKRNEPKAIHEP